MKVFFSVSTSTTYIVSGRQAVGEEGLSADMSLTLGNIRLTQVLVSHILLCSIKKGLQRQTFEWVLRV